MVADILKDAERIDRKNMKRGKYFRIAADVIVDGENLADILIEASVAIQYRGARKLKTGVSEIKGVKNLRDTFCYRLIFKNCFKKWLSPSFTKTMFF